MWRRVRLSWEAEWEDDEAKKIEQPKVLAARRRKKGRTRVHFMTTTLILMD